MRKKRGSRSGTMTDEVSPGAQLGCEECSAACGLMMPRRSFLTAAGAAALAMQTEMLNFTSSLFAKELETRAKPKITVILCQRQKGGGLTYPTATTGQLCDIKGLFFKTLKDAAERFCVELDIHPEPLANGNPSLERIKKTAPDGLIIIGNDLRQGWGKSIPRVLANRGEIPTIVYSNVCAFIPRYRSWSNYPKTFIAATEDVNHLATAVRMHRAVWDWKNLKLLNLPGKNWENEYKKTADSDELRAIADFYIKNAVEVVEPTKDQVLAAAKNYITIRRLMTETGCNGVTVSGRLCIGAATKPNAVPACVAVSKLLDDGIPAACQGDRDSAYMMRMMFSLTGQPGFMGNTCADTFDNTLILTHCTSSLKLEGPDKAYSAPYRLRDFHSAPSVAMMVAWPIGRDVTVVDMADKNTVIVGEGPIVANTGNVPQPPCGGCRTSVDIAVEGVQNVLDIKCTSLHQYIVLGRHKRSVSNYCKLAGLKCFDLTLKTQYA